MKGWNLPTLTNYLHSYPKDTKLFLYSIEISISQPLFHWGKPKNNFLCAEEPLHTKTFPSQKICYRRAFLSLEVRIICNNTKQTQEKWKWNNLQYKQSKMKQTHASTHRLLQYFQLPDKQFLYILWEVWNFSRYLEVSIY